jgi:hypothetical protein
MLAGRRAWYMLAGRREAEKMLLVRWLAQGSQQSAGSSPRPIPALERGSQQRWRLAQY